MILLPAPHDRPVDPPARRAAPRAAGETALFAALALLYFTVGYLLLMRYHLFDWDSVSRVANAGYVLYSRDPHLSALGFVWNPLPSLVELPILQLSPWWSALLTHGLAGVVQSSLFMAAGAVVVGRIANDCGVGPGWRRLAVAAFALQPMIIVYGASGMSEASETFCVLWSARRLMRWTVSRSAGDLACAGVALGVGYLSRYEVVPGALGAAAFVGYLSIRGAQSARIVKATASIAIVMFPIVVAATVWALSGWVVNQELFATLSSRYGNANIVAEALRRSGAATPAGWSDLWSIAARILGMQPFTGIAVAGAVIHAAVTGRTVALAPVVVFGPILAFAVWGQVTAATFGLFRYYLLAIPMVICIALALWTSPRTRRVGAALVCASVFVGFPVTVVASLNARIGNQPLQFGFNSLFFPHRQAGQPPHQVWYRREMDGERFLAGYLDRQRLPDGAVLMDTFNCWGIWMSSSRPRQFVITSDYDFKAALNRPWDHGVQYLLVSNPDISDGDALNVRYPTLWNDGADMARLVYAVQGTGGEERFRLYRIDGVPKRLRQPSVVPP